MPRDTDSTFEPQIVKKRQRRLTGVDEIVLSLYRQGTDHRRDLRRTSPTSTGRTVSKDTISRITDKVIEEMTEWW